MSILDTVKDDSLMSTYRPSTIRFDTSEDVLILRRNGSVWSVERHPHRMGRPLMEPMIWNATPAKAV